MSDARIKLRLLLEGGQSQTVEVAANAPELTRLYQVLGGRTSRAGTSEEQFFQFPVDGGRESFSFSSAQLVAFSTRPPVVVQFEQQQEPLPQPAQDMASQVYRPPFMVIDNFLGHYEHADMLAYALQRVGEFNRATVATGEQNVRQNLVILNFAQAAHSRLLCNRLLTWLPLILKTLEIPQFPVQQVESQLTASNDGHYYRPHLDADEAKNIKRVLTCVYYFSKQPAQFTGGALRIYDSRIVNGTSLQADTFQQLEPVSNRMVVFPSQSYHELRPIRCPSHKFEDSRFAVTNWIWKQDQPDAEATHGWGHMHCAKALTGWM